MTEPALTSPPRLDVLVVDDELNIRRTLGLCLEARGHVVTAVGSASDAAAAVERHAFDLAFIDLRLGTDDGLALLPRIQQACPWMKIVVITAFASIETAVEAIRRGATDYIPKPFTPDQIDIVLDRVGTLRGMEQRIMTLKEDLARFHPRMSFQSHAPAMQRAIALAQQVATSEAVVLLRGPSGTGKTALAQAMHEWSPRAAMPFGIVSCPTLGAELLESELFGHVKGAFTGAHRDNPGRIAACEGGTLFLDEIGDMPLSLQPKLLRFVQDRMYERVGDHRTRTADVRIMTATNTDLEEAVRVGRFREDLYYRLNVIQIDLPPLADRPDDVVELAREMLLFFAAQNHKVLVGFADEALQVLQAYSWPGNVRELRNVVERAAILCTSPVVGTEHLPTTLASTPHPLQLGDHVSLADIEEQHIRRVLATTRSLQEAADILGIDQATLWRKRKQSGI